MRRLTGRVAVVTGAASGIGRAMAARFAAEGMRCVLADVETEPLDRAVAELRRSGAAAIGVRTDVASAADVRALADRAVAEFGAVHVLCNNAGVGSGSDFSTIPLEVWEWVLGVTLWGVIHGCRTFLPILLEQDEAHIVNTSSMAALNGHPLGLVNAFTPLTLEPPQVIVCLARTSTTWRAISQARVFAVNVLAADQLLLARLFATKQRDKFRQVPVTSCQGVLGTPVLDGALATLECGLAEAIMRDTHMVLIGKVVRMRHDRTKSPALYFRSRLYEGFEAALVGGPGPAGDGVRSSPGEVGHEP